jgi:hypothetical protein
VNRVRRSVLITEFNSRKRQYFSFLRQVQTGSGALQWVRHTLPAGVKGPATRLHLVPHVTENTAASRPQERLPAWLGSGSSNELILIRSTTKWTLLEKKTAVNTTMVLLEDGGLGTAAAVCNHHSLTNGFVLPLKTRTAH